MRVAYHITNNFVFELQTNTTGFRLRGAGTGDASSIQMKQIISE
jgi:hypothetical protein